MAFTVNIHENTLYSYSNTWYQCVRGSCGAVDSHTDRLKMLRSLVLPQGTRYTPHISEWGLIPPRS